MCTIPLICYNFNKITSKNLVLCKNPTVLMCLENFKFPNQEESKHRKSIYAAKFGLFTQMTTWLKRGKRKGKHCQIWVFNNLGKLKTFCVKNLAFAIVTA